MVVDEALDEEDGIPFSRRELGRQADSGVTVFLAAYAAPDRADSRA